MRSTAPPAVPLLTPAGDGPHPGPTGDPKRNGAVGVHPPLDAPQPLAPPWLQLRLIPRLPRGRPLAAGLQRQSSLLLAALWEPEGWTPGPSKGAAAQWASCEGLLAQPEPQGAWGRGQPGPQRFAPLSRPLWQQLQLAAALKQPPLPSPWKHSWGMFSLIHTCCGRAVSTAQ